MAKDSGTSSEWTGADSGEPPTSDDWSEEVPEEESNCWDWADFYLYFGAPFWYLVPLAYFGVISPRFAPYFDAYPVVAVSVLIMICLSTHAGIYVLLVEKV